jgi:hypothetical protein
VKQKNITVIIRATAQMVLSSIESLALTVSSWVTKYSGLVQRGGSEVGWSKVALYPARGLFSLVADHYH